MQHYIFRRYDRQGLAYENELGSKASDCYRMLKERVHAHYDYFKSQLAIGKLWLPLSLLPGEIPWGLENADEFVPVIDTKTGLMFGAFFRQRPAEGLSVY